MAVGWGIEPLVSNGVVTSGTSSEDVRKIWGGLYSEGVISGCAVSTSSTGLTYKVATGVVAIDVGVGETVMCAVPATTVTTGEVTADRTDIVYVEQKIPGASNSTVIGVAQGTAIPANAVELGTYMLKAGDTNTANSFKSGSTLYSIPYGAFMGTFMWHTDSSNDLIPRETRTQATGSFYLPTDRKISISLDACLSAVRSDGVTKAYRFDDAAYCEVVYEVWIDGTKRYQWNTPGLHQAWATYHFEEYWNLSKGQHTVSYKTRYGGSNPGWAMRHHYGTNAATGTSFCIVDAGVNK